MWPDDDEVPASKSSVDLTTRVWRRGNLLVKDRHARLPELCLFTGLPATQRVELALYYYPLAAHLSLLLGIASYLAAMLEHSANTIPIEVPLCERMFRRQLAQLFFGAILGGLGAVAVLAAIAFGCLTKEHEMAIVFIAVGATIGLGGLALGFVGSSLIAHKIDTDYIWLRGIHRDFLNELPEWPGK